MPTEFPMLESKRSPADVVGGTGEVAEVHAGSEEADPLTAPVLEVQDETPLFSPNSVRDALSISYLAQGETSRTFPEERKTCNSIIQKIELIGL